MSREIYTFKVATIKEEFSIGFKKWLFMNSLQRYENFQGTITRFEDNEDDNPSVYSFDVQEESYIFDVETIINNFERMDFQGESFSFDAENDRKFINNLFGEDILYFEIEFNIDYFGN